MKKFILLLVVSTVVLCGLEAAALPNDLNETPTLTFREVSRPSLLMADVLDQQQTEMDNFGPIGPSPMWANLNYIIAQSFTPTKPVLTRVEVLIKKNTTATYDYSVAIRNALNGADLALASVPAGQIVSGEYRWVEFDFTDIAVSPGTPYYLVSYTRNLSNNWYAWGMKMSDVYADGAMYFTVNDGGNWLIEPDADMTFKTYGRENNAPNVPSITGRVKGKTGSTYSYTFKAVDSDGDDVYFWIDWGDNSSVEEWIGPYGSGKLATVQHAFTTEGTYTIKAKAKDFVGAESDWGSLEVTMPKTTALGGSVFLQHLFARFPHAFPILRYLFGSD